LLKASALMDMAQMVFRLYLWWKLSVPAQRTRIAIMLFQTYYLKEKAGAKKRNIC
jgi:hypothetical protein